MKGMTMLALGALLLTSGACAQNADSDRFQEGVHYTLIENAAAPADSEKVEVVEVFSYMCPHCYSFQPYINNWHENLPEYVSFSRLPVTWRNWKPMAQAYYAAETLGIVEESHLPMFQALHQERRQFRGEEDLAEFYSQFGVDAATFSETMGSFAVDMKLRQGDKRTRDFGVTGTPSVVVAGKYRISASTQVNQPTMVEVAKFLVEKERGANGTQAGSD